MGGVKDEHTDSPTNVADAHDLDAWLNEGADLSEEEIHDLARRMTYDALQELDLRMIKVLHRWNYYNEPVDVNEFDYLHRELQRIIGGFP